MTIHIYNTLTRRLEPLEPIEPGHVKMYVCGMTVYDYCHLGHGRTFAAFDIVVRWLRARGYRVTYVRNITDVDDKIIRRAAENGETTTALTERFIRAMHEDFAALGFVPPDLEPRATQFVPQMLGLIELLEKKDLAYTAEDGDVNFAVRRFPGYGKLSGKSLDELRAGERVAVDAAKRDPLDFVLWKPSTPELPGWDSPWGRGRPGWHVECTAMIGRHLGHTIDIHGGGQDLIFPHHENEIAQGSCAHDALYCRTWVHNSFVTVDGQKMSKSLGNVLLVRELLAEAPGEAIRFALLATHYRNPLHWNARRLAQARQTLTRWYGALACVEAHDGGPAPAQTVEPDALVLAALRDDLNVPLAISRLHELVSQLAHATDPDEQREAAARLRASAALLGLLQQHARSALAALRHQSRDPRHAPLTPERAEALVAERDAARQRRDFARADALRQELDHGGVLLEDTPQGTQWRFADHEAQS